MSDFNVRSLPKVNDFLSQQQAKRQAFFHGNSSNSSSPAASQTANSANPTRTPSPTPPQSANTTNAANPAQPSNPTAATRPAANTTASGDLAQISRQPLASANTPSTYPNDFLGNRQLARDLRKVAGALESGQQPQDLSPAGQQALREASRSVTAQSVAGAQVPGSNPERQGLAAPVGNDFVSRRQFERYQSQQVQNASASERADRLQQTQNNAQSQIQRMAQSGLVI
jgi:hypothetical protein